MKTSYVTTLSLALVLAFITVSVCFAFSQAVYFGRIREYLAYGSVFTLAGTGVLVLTMSLFSNIPNATGRPQDEPLPILIISTQIIAAHLIDGRAGFLTILASICLTSIITGCLLYAAGLLKWGKYARFIPFPVIAGLLAGSGILLMVSCIGQVVPTHETSWRAMSQLWNAESMLLWIPSLVFGVVVFFIAHKFKNPLSFPMSIIIGIVLFYAACWLSGTSIASLESMGLLTKTQPISMQALSDAVNASEGVQWRLIINNLGWIVMVAMTSILTLLFIVMSLEITHNKDYDFNKELRVAGAANVLSGCVGGLVGYHGLGNAMFADKFNVNSRLLGMVCAAACFLAIFFPDIILSYFPRYILIGLIFFLGLSLFHSWTFAIHKRFDRLDKILIFIIIVVMLVYDFVYAMLIGNLIAILFFTYTYSNLSIVRYVIRGNTISSTFERDPRSKEILRRYKSQIVYIKLHGYLFFGSANAIVEHLRELIATNTGEEIKYVIYDMTRVVGGDTSCIMSFERISEYARDKNFHVFLTGLDLDKNRSLYNKLSSIIQNSLFLFPQTDQAINSCELAILKEHGCEPDSSESMAIRLEDYIGDKSFADDIDTYFTDVDIDENEYLIHQRDASHDVFYLESGLLAVYVEQSDQIKYLIAVIEPGNFIGEIAYYLHSQRSASVQALKKSRVRKIDFINAKKLRHKNPELAHAVDQALITSLSYKLLNTTQKLDVVSK